MKVDLQSPVDLVVGTPGTLLQFCEKGMEPYEGLTKCISPGLTVSCHFTVHSPSLRKVEILKVAFELLFYMFLNSVCDDELAC